MRVARRKHGQISRARRWRGGCLAVILGGSVLALSPAPAGAATVIHVDNANAACSDAGPGSAAAPLCTIGAGTARAVAGDTVLVATGTYPEQATVAHSGTSAAPIVVAAAPGASVIVSGQANGFRVNARSWVTIRGFKVADTTSHGINVTDSSNITLDGNDIGRAGTPALNLTARGISFSTSTNSVLRGNAVHGNSDAGIFVGVGSTGNLLSGNASWANAQGFARAAAGIDVRGASTTVIGNRSFGNEDSGINIWNGAHATVVSNNAVWGNGDHGIDVKVSNQVKVLSNSLLDSHASGVEVFNSAAVVMANNILVDNGLNSPGDSGNLFVDGPSSTTMTADYDLMDLTTSGEMVTWAGVQYDTMDDFRSATGQEPNGTEADPDFVDESAGNLRLLAGSPAIDAANSGVAGHPATDSLGKPRVDDPATTNTGAGVRTFDDRGAYEFQPPPPPTTVPSAPTIGTATGGNSQASVTWSPPASNGGSPVTGYVVTPFVDGDDEPDRTFASPATSQTITGLTNGTAYTFRVAAINAVGTGAQSAESNAVTPATTASFTTGPRPSVPGSPPMTVTGYKPVAGDFNGDDHGDVFWYGAGSKTEVLWTGRDDATFTAVPTLQQSATLTPLPGDFDGDGRDDVFWYGAGSAVDSFWRGTANGGFVVATPRSVSGTYTPVVGDFTGEGRSDIYWYGVGSAPDALWTGQANATFTSATARAMSGTYRPIVGQFGGNGADDIYWYAPGATAEVLWLGTTNAAFTVTATRSATGTYTPISGDFNGDGSGDIFWYGPGSAADALWSGSPTGFVTRPPRVVNGTYVPAALDVNDDGHDDIYFHADGSAPDALLLGGA